MTKVGCVFGLECIDSTGVEVPEHDERPVKRAVFEVWSGLGTVPAPEKDDASGRSDFTC